MYFIDDGHYPRIKKPEEHNINDVKILLKINKTSNLKLIIEAMSNE